MRILIETSPLAILTLDQSGRIALANESARELFGLERRIAAGQRCGALPADSQPHAARARALRQSAHQRGVQGAAPQRRRLSGARVALHVPHLGGPGTGRRRLGRQREPARPRRRGLRFDDGHLARADRRHLARDPQSRFRRRVRPRPARRRMPRSGQRSVSGAGHADPRPGKDRVLRPARRLRPRGRGRGSRHRAR